MSLDAALDLLHRHATLWQMRSQWSRRFRDLASTVVVLAGIWLILGDRATGSHRWWGALIGLLIAVGLVELLVGLRALRDEWNWRAAGGSSVGVGMVALALVLTDSWRWLAAGAWPVAVVLVMMTAWPEPREG